MYALTITITIIAITITATATQKPSGGAPCKLASDCGGAGRATCDEYAVNETHTAKHCICFPQYGAPDCSYNKISRALIAGLQLGLPFVGIDGIGNCLAGHTSRFLAQLLMGLSFYLAVIPICILACIVGCSGLAKHGEALGKLAGGCLGCIVCGLIFSAFVWSLVDGAAMLNDPNWVDANGYPPY